jgi:hypothetical protein
MAGAPFGRSPFPGLFVAYPPARRNWRAMAPAIPEPSPRPDFDPSDYEGLIDYPSELPDVDDMVRAYGRGEPWPGEADAPLGETATAAGADPAPNDVDPHLDPIAEDDIDPEVQRAANAVRDEIEGQADSDRTEYGATIYRDGQGRVGRTKLIRGQSGQLDGLPPVPKGATVEGYARNHPLQTAVGQGKRAGLDKAQSDDYIARQAIEPSDADMGSMRYAYGARTAPSALVYVYGPDKGLRAYGPQFIGHPVDPDDLKRNLGLQKPVAP